MSNGLYLVFMLLAVATRFLCVRYACACIGVCVDYVWMVLDVAVTFGTA